MRGEAVAMKGRGRPGGSGRIFACYQGRQRLAGGRAVLLAFRGMMSGCGGPLLGHQGRLLGSRGTLTDDRGVLTGERGLVRSKDTMLTFYGRALTGCQGALIFYRETLMGGLNAVSWHQRC